MAGILGFSTDTFSAAQTGSILEPLLRAFFPAIAPATVVLVHTFVRKSAHLTLYGILAWLWFRAFRRERVLGASAAAAVALAVSLAWAVVDEGHQATVPSRTPSAWDVAIDGAGATAALAALRLGGAYAAEGFARR